MAATLTHASTAKESSTVNNNSRIHTGRGSANRFDLYWRIDWYIWNNDGDTATLKTRGGRRAVPEGGTACQRGLRCLPETRPGSKPSPTRRRSVRISLATLATLVGLATGLFTLREQIFGSADPSSDGPASQEKALPTFQKGGIDHFEDAEAFIDFLQANDGKAVKLTVSFGDVTSFGIDTEGGDDPYVTLYYEPCVTRPPPGQHPGLEHGCVGTNVVVSGEDPAVPSQLYYSSGLRLQGYFAVQSAGGEMHQGISGIILRALSFEQATAN